MKTFRNLAGALLCLVHFSSSGSFGNPAISVQTPIPENTAVPVITVIPDSISATILNCGDSLTIPLTLHNSGDTVLNFSAAWGGYEFSDNFENGLSKWVYNGYWSLTAEAYEGNYGLTAYPGMEYIDNMNQYFQMKDSIIVFDQDSCYLSYKLRYAFTSIADRMLTYIQVNNGNWVLVNTVQGNQWNQGWKTRTVNLSPHVQNGDYFKIKYVFISNAANVNFGVRIDNFKIYGAAGQIPWLRISSGSGSIEPGDSVSIICTLISSGKNAGIYEGQIRISSNDSANPFQEVVVRMNVIGSPVVNLYPPYINFQSTPVNGQRKAFLKLKNDGCAPLLIDSVIINPAFFSTDALSGVLAPSDSVSVEVSFVPADTGIYHANIIFYTSSGTDTISLQGYGIFAPVIVTFPDSILLNLVGCNDTVTGELTISNPGLSALHVNATLDLGVGMELKPAVCEPYTSWWDYLDMQIFRVSLKDIDNITWIGTTNGYEDYSDSISTSLEIGATYPVYIQSGLVYNVNVRVWIDFNNDGDFNMQDELLFESLNVNSDHYGNITIPDNAPCFIPLRMRVMSEYYEYPMLPCLDLEYGQCEDYKVVLSNHSYIYPDSLTVEAGDSAIIQLHILSEHLISGTFTSAVSLSSDDPVNPDSRIPLVLIENGIPAISVSEDSLSFGPVMENTIEVDTLIITNTGCDTLKVFSISASLPIFTSAPSEAYILPHDSGEFVIQYAPLTAGYYQDSLSVNTNAQLVTIPLTGLATESPSLVLSADTVMAEIGGCNDSVVEAVTIFNHGNADLIFEVTQYEPMKDGFENGLGKWIYDGFWSISPDAHSGSGSLTQSPGSPGWQYLYQSIAMDEAVMVTSPEDCKLTFWLKWDLLQDEDFFYTEIQVNGGGWINLEWLTGESDWAQKSFDLSSFVDSGDYVKVMFGFYSISLSNPGIRLDDLFLEGAGNMEGWLNIHPLLGTLSPGDSILLNLSMNSASINADNYEHLWFIRSNDPLNPLRFITTLLQVNGNPELSIQDSLVQFPTIMQYTTVSQGFVIRNRGCDTLVVSDIINGNPDFQLPFTSLLVKPYDSAMFQISFNPQQTGIYDEFIQLQTNAGDTFIHLSGVSTPAPRISLSQDTLSAALLCEVTSTHTITLRNTGGIPLDFSTFQDNYWFGIMPFFGSIPPGDSTEITITVNKQGLSSGIYEGHLWINSNDPLHPSLPVAFQMTVLNSYIPVNLGPDRQLCIGDTLVLHAGSAYSSYLWNETAGDSTLNVTSSGEYSVLVTDNAGCTYSDTLVVVFNIRPILELGQDITLCSSSPYSFSPSVQNSPPGSSVIAHLGGGGNFTSAMGRTPFGTYCMDNRTQMLYSAGEMLSAGMAAGMISTIAFNVGNPGSPAMTNFSIKMGSITHNFLTEAVPDLSLVYTSASYAAVAGWNTFTLDTPFYWDGTRNLIIEVCFDNDIWSYSSSVQYTYVQNSVWSGWCDNCVAGCNITSGDVFSERANIRLNNDIDISQYTWTGPSGSYNTTRIPDFPQISSSDAGLYVLMVTNTYGCSGSDSIYLTVIPNPLVDAGSDTSMIYGNPVTLNATIAGASGPYTLQWFPETGLSDPLILNPLANPLSTTAYVLHATAQNLCTGSDTVVVTDLLHQWNSFLPK